MNLRGNSVKSLATKRNKKKTLTLVTDAAEAVTTAVDPAGVEIVAEVGSGSLQAEVATVVVLAQTRSSPSVRKTSLRAATTITTCTRHPLANRRRRAASSKSPTSTTKKPSRLSDRPMTVDNDGLVKCFAAKYGARELAMGSKVMQTLIQLQASSLEVGDES